MARMDWTAARDAVLRRLRAEGCGWPEIGRELQVSPDVARERGRRIGARFPTHLPRPPAEDRARPARPPGHPATWGLLVEGTTLAGCPWPGWRW
jgi:hypothetical protein